MPALQKFRCIIWDSSLQEGVSWGCQEVPVSRWWFRALTLIFSRHTKWRGRKDYASSFCTVIHWLTLLSGRRETWATFLFGACGDLKVHVKGCRWMLQQKKIFWVTEERQGSCLCSHKYLSILHLVFNRACAGVKPPPSLSPGHRLLLSLP